MNNLIFRYTQAQAIADGALTRACSKKAAEAGITVPVLLTRGCEALCRPTSDEEDFGQSYAGRVWDVLWMTSNAIRRHRGGDRVTVPVFFVTRGRPGIPDDTRLVKMLAVAGPGDDGGMCVTIGPSSDF